ncbi:MAG: class I adenylate-forming enzyme family protein [Flavobacteriaceae bacterium]
MKFSIPDELKGMTLASMLEDRAAAHPNRVAIAGMSAIGIETRVTYAQLLWQGKKFGSALAALGIKPGDRVGAMLANDAVIEFAQTIAGIHALGGVFVPVNARFAVEEVVYVVNKSGARALVVRPDQAAKLSVVRDRMPDLHALIVLGSGKGSGEHAGSHDWHTIVEAADVGALKPSERGPEDMAEILFTSGTTAHPKGAVHTHRSAVCSSYSMAKSFALKPDDTLQTFMPMFTSGGARFFTCVVYAGCSMVFDPVLDVDQVVARMLRERTTRYVGTSAFYIFLIERAAEVDIDLSNLDALMFGGSPTTAEVVRRLTKTFPHVELRNLFAPTETGPAGTLIVSPEILDKPTSVGVPWPLVEVAIVDDDNNLLPANRNGEICTRGPCVMTGYFGDPELSAEALKGGWHHTGDVGYLDEDGYLYIMDRKKDMVIRGGHNIASLEVEQVLSQHDAVAEAAIVGVPHPKLGEDIHAFVIARGDLKPSAEELRAFCADKLADYKIPRKISIVKELPRGPLGKVLKTELREIAARSQSGV